MVKKNLLEAEKPYQTWKYIAIGTLKLKNATEIWTEMLQSKTRSKDLKIQKIAIRLYIYERQ